MTIMLQQLLLVFKVFYLLTEINFPKSIPELKARYIYSRYFYTILSYTDKTGRTDPDTEKRTQIHTLKTIRLR